MFAPACGDDYDDYDLAVVADVLAMLSLYFAVLGRSLIIVVYVVDNRGLATLRLDFSLTFSDCFFWAVLGRPLTIVALSRESRICFLGLGLTLTLSDRDLVSADTGLTAMGDVIALTCYVLSALACAAGDLPFSILDSGRWDLTRDD